MTKTEAPAAKFDLTGMPSSEKDISNTLAKRVSDAFGTALDLTLEKAVKRLGEHLGKKLAAGDQRVQMTLRDVGVQMETGPILQRVYVLQYREGEILAHVVFDAALTLIPQQNAVMAQMGTPQVKDGVHPLFSKVQQPEHHSRVLGKDGKPLS